MQPQAIHHPQQRTDYAVLAADIKRWGMELGFQQIGIARLALEADEAYLLSWLAAGRHGEMDYMARHGTRRSRPAELVPGVLRAIMARMDAWPGDAAPAKVALNDPARAYLARYALGRDYHKRLRNRLAQLARRISTAIGPSAHRVFVDSAPVLEKALARNAGLGWIGKHTNLIHPRAGSTFMLGGIYTDLPLPVDTPLDEHCGSCRACLDACPTQAIVAPYQLDARRCISYLTIELKGAIPLEFRSLIGNRVFGCDDCQLCCPWNRFAHFTGEPDFAPRHGLDSAGLIELLAWDEDIWRARTEGSALRRPGYEGWLRNLAVALGNAPRSDAVRDALLARADHPSALVREHVAWALMRQAGA
jgi:epoxyqueuosine reductase